MMDQWCSASAGKIGRVRILASARFYFFFVVYEETEEFFNDYVLIIEHSTRNVIP